MSVEAGELVTRVAVAVGGAPEGLCEQALRGAFGDVCQTTRIWKRRATATVPEGHVAKAGALVALPPPPDNTRRDDISGILVNGKPAPGLWGEVHSCGILDRLGVVKAGDELEWTETLAPTAGSVGDIPEEVLALGGEAAVALAAASLLDMPRRPWSNPAAAMAFAQEYSRKIGRLIHRDLTGGRGDIRMGLEGAIDE